MAKFDKVRLVIGIATSPEARMDILESVHDDPSYQVQQLLEPYRDSVWEFIAVIDAWAVPGKADEDINEQSADEASPDASAQA